MFKFNIEKIKIGEEEINSVSAIEFHSQLEVKTRFNDWIKRRVKKYNFEEGIDYITTTQKRVTAQGNLIEYTDYIITLDMAKELGMVENNTKGKDIRNYFINLEKDYQRLQEENLKLVKENLRLANKKLDNLKGKDEDYYSVKAVRHITGKYFEADKLMLYSFENRIRISSEWDVDKQQTRNLYHKDVWFKVHGVKL